MIMKKNPEYKYSGSAILEGVSIEKAIKLAKKMHPEMTEKDIKDKLLSGEGISISIGYFIEKTKKVIDKLREGGETNGKKENS